MAKKNKKEDKTEVIQLGMVGVAAVFSIVLIVLLGMNATISAEATIYKPTEQQLCLEDCTRLFADPAQRDACYQTCLPRA